ncbi:MAG: hypothetical protein JWQ40_4732 [Segetibacter sp.]|nr:hypothetical protein [Segetibacter sp.]
MGDYRLPFSQVGAGSGDHPFKTVKAYGDFLQRINAFVMITDTAIANMRVNGSIQVSDTTKPHSYSKDLQTIKNNERIIGILFSFFFCV